MAGDFGGKPPANRLIHFITEHINWARAFSTQVWNATHSQPQFDGKIVIGGRALSPLQAAFWRQVYLLIRQLDGVTDGVIYALRSRRISFLNIYLLNSAGDLEDLIGVFTDDGQPAHDPKPFRIRYEDLPGGEIMSTGMDCSAFVKPIGSQGFVYEPRRN